MSDILKEHEYEFEMATLDMKGRRFRTAEEKFRELIKSTNSSEAWCGLAAAKFGLLFENSSVDEVFHCFEKARETGNSLAELDTAIISLCETTIRELHSLYVKAVRAERKAQRRAFESALMTGFSALASVGERNKSQMETIAYTATTAISFSNYISANNTIQELKNFQDKANNLIALIRTHVNGFFMRKSEVISLFNEVCEALDIETKELTLTEAEQKKIVKDREQKEKEDLVKKYQEDNKHIIDDTLNPFHKYKNDGVEDFKNKKYKAAIEQFDKAIQIYREDSEVKELRLKSVTKLLDNRVKRDLLIAGALLLIRYLVTGSFNNDNFVGAYIMIALAVIIYRRVAGYNKYYPFKIGTKLVDNN